jgi:hypothetical protein
VIIAGVNVYRIDNFRLGDRCELGPIEVAVMANDGRNILGMSTLAKTAPFGVHADPPALAVSVCTAVANPQNVLAVSK